MRNRMFARYPARLRFIELPEDAAAAAAATAAADAAAAAAAATTSPAELGFPVGVSEKDMTEPQKIAYWRHHSRQHEAEEKRLKAINATYIDKAGRFDALELENATDSQKAVLAARAEGVLEGSRAYLSEAVTSRLLLLTGKSEEDLRGALDLIDVVKLTTPEGALDTAKVQALATSIGTATPAVPPAVPPVNAVAAALAAQSQSTTPVGGSSIAEMEKNILAEAAAKRAALNPNQ